MTGLLSFYNKFFLAVTNLPSEMIDSVSNPISLHCQLNCIAQSSS